MMGEPNDVVMPLAFERDLHAAIFVDRLTADRFTPSIDGDRSGGDTLLNERFGDFPCALFGKLLVLIRKPVAIGIALSPGSGPAGSARRSF